MPAEQIKRVSGEVTGQCSVYLILVSGSCVCVLVCKRGRGGLKEKHTGQTRQVLQCNCITTFVDAYFFFAPQLPTNDFTPANLIAQLKGLHVQNFIAELGLSVARSTCLLFMLNCTALQFHQYGMKKYPALHPRHTSSLAHKKMRCCFFSFFKLMPAL